MAGELVPSAVECQWPVMKMTGHGKKKPHKPKKSQDCRLRSSCPQVWTRSKGCYEMARVQGTLKPPPNIIKIIKHQGSALVSAGSVETDIPTCCCQLLQGVRAVTEQALNKLYSYHVQIGKEWSQHGADKGFVVFWGTGKYQGLHKHTCTDQLRKRSNT